MRSRLGVAQTKKFNLCALSSERLLRSADKLVIIAIHHKLGPWSPLEDAKPESTAAYHA